MRLQYKGPFIDYGVTNFDAMTPPPPPREDRDYGIPLWLCIDEDKTRHRPRPSHLSPELLVTSKLMNVPNGTNKFSDWAEL